MFGRYLPTLRDQGADLCVVCDPRHLARLFEAAGYHTVPYYKGRPPPPADYWTLFGSIPLRCGGGPPPPPSYLSVEAARTEHVGVMARGKPSFKFDAHRSLPAAFAERLLRLGSDLRPEATGALDFLDTARIVAGMDMVVTVDTASAHVAGAMGKRAVVLLPYEWRDFRWNDGAHSVWYPDFTLLRQHRPGDWASVFDQLVALLEARVAQSTLPA